MVGLEDGGWGACSKEFGRLLEAESSPPPTAGKKNGASVPSQETESFQQRGRASRGEHTQPRDTLTVYPEQRHLPSLTWPPMSR